MVTGRKTALVLAIFATAALLAAPAAAKTKKKPPITEMSASSPSVFGNGAIATATAVCPPSRRAVGGGFLESVPQLVANTSQGSVYESFKVGQNAWRVSSQLFADSADDRLDLTAFVYCRRGAPVTSTTTVTAPQQNGIAISPPVTASCVGKKRKALAGGFSTPPPFATPTSSTSVLDSLRSAPRAWSARLLALGTASTLTTYTYCAKAKKAPPAPSIASSPISTSGTTATAVAPCTGRTKRPLGGGFSQPQATANIPASQLGLFVPYESRRISTAWQVSGVFAGSPPGTIVSTAYCG